MMVELCYKELAFSFVFEEASVSIGKLKDFLKRSIKAKHEELNPHIDSDQKLKNDIWLLIQDEVTFKLYSINNEGITERDDEFMVKQVKSEIGEGFALHVFHVCAILKKTHEIEKCENNSVEDLITKMTGGETPLKKRLDNVNKKTISLSNILDPESEDYLELISTLARDPSSRQGGIRIQVLERLLASLNNNTAQTSNSYLNSNSIELPRHRPEPRPTVEPDLQMIEQLSEMGFPEARARQALITTRNNIENAVEYLSNFEENEEESDGQVSNHNNFVINGEDDIGDIDIEIEEDEP